MNKIKPVWFYLLSEIMFLGKTQWSHTCAEYVILFSEFHYVETETSMSGKELFNKQCPLVQYRKGGNTFFSFLLK